MTLILAVFDETEFRAQFGSGVNLQLRDMTNGPELTQWGTDEYCYPCANVLDCGECPDGILNEFDRDWMYSEFIERNAERIQFNRYSGVPLK